MKRVPHLPGPLASMAAVPLLLGVGFGGAHFGAQAWAAPVPADGAGPASLVIRTNYHGWTNAIFLSNGRVEAIVVPEIGRVIQFRFAGAGHGPFWENVSLRGRQADAGSTEWADFGGDKAWPAPRAEWDGLTGRSEPPPVGFDGMPYEARVDGWVVTLIGPVDPHYGIRVSRTIELTPEAPAMIVRTAFEKVARGSLEVGVWVSTQLQNPLAVATPLPLHSRFRDGYIVLEGEPPSSLKIRDGILSLKRNPGKSHRIGTDSGALFWIGDDSVLRIDSPRVPYRPYPDDGCSVEIHTAADADGGYVALDMLGPRHKLVVGQRLERASTYTLLPRAELDPALEARMLRARDMPRGSPY